MIGVSTEVVGDPGGVGFSDGLAFDQGLGRGEGVIEGVRPDASGFIDCDCAVGGGRRADKAPGAGRVRIRIRDQKGGRNSCRTCIVTSVIEMTGLSNAAGTGGDNISYHRTIICAINGDSDRLIDIGIEVVGNPGGKALGDGLAFLERLGGRLAVIKAVGPHTSGGIDRNRAIGGGRRTADTPGAGRPAIHIGGA